MLEDPSDLLGNKHLSRHWFLEMQTKTHHCNDLYEEISVTIMVKNAGQYLSNHSDYWLDFSTTKMKS